MTQTKEKTITVSKLSHRQNLKSGFISYCCELRVGRTCYASIEQEGNGGDERVGWNSTENYLFIHHWILNTQKEFYKDYQYEYLNYYSNLIFHHHHFLLAQQQRSKFYLHEVHNNKK